MPVTANTTLVTLAISGFAMFAVPLGATAQPSTAPHHGHPLEAARGCPVRQLADGSLVDCHGWRKWWGSFGWDNTCLNLDYLPSQFACSFTAR
jgi:hypothetical protein